jgi:hypothetical protein
MKRLPDHLRQQVETLLRAGHSDRAVHQKTGVARTTVVRYRKALGLPGYRVTANSPACRHGHPFPENVAHYANGWLYCLACKQARQRAQYIPAQPDEAAIERAVAGDPPERLTPRERHAAIRRLDRHPLPAQIIAERVGCSKRTVHRARQAVAV